MINISEKQPATAPQFSQSAPAESLESSIQAALEHARRLTEMNGVESVETALAWEVVEELMKAKREQKAKTPTPFEHYCDTYPEAVECRVYDL
ncbi:MAG: Calvin cycle protein CP12 [Leptolyngbyaceae cyanobacterium MO_188.B28]|nr:Calvin cycle protein CP12 [Leptolyngbyaceae cyanobacterium MO_188.B28]